MNDDKFSKIDNYINTLFSLQDEKLKLVEDEIRKADIGWQNISVNQGKLIQMMALICKAERILEIGTFGGYSSIWLARALRTGGLLTTIELDEAFAKIAKKNFVITGLQDKIELIVGDALNVLPKLKKENRVFDMIFIDAKNSSYPQYLEESINLSKPGTVIIADNVIKTAKVLEDFNQEEETLAVRKFNEMLSNIKYLDSTIIQTVGHKIPDGISISIVK